MDTVFRNARPVLWTLLALCQLLPAVAPSAAAAEAGEPSATEPTPELLALDTAGRPGGRLVVALGAAPKSLNPLTVADHPSQTVAYRLHADLVHIDAVDQRPEPALARSWTVSPDGRRFRLELRRGIRFSDGHPLDADDVLFTFRAYLDPDVGSPQRDLLIVGGEPIAVGKLGSHTVEIELAEPYAVGVRLFDSLAILPEHRLAEAYREGRLAEAWGLGTPPEEIVGLGPFRVRRHLPGERLELERNPHYWKVDREGRRLPYLDELVFLFVPDENAELLLFQNGQTHLIDDLSSEDFTRLQGEAERRGLRLEDLGPGLAYHFLFWNLNDLAGRELPEIARKQRWFGEVAFRRAVSLAIDRQAMVRLVYRGRATPIATHVSPGNRLWRNQNVPVPERSLPEARRLLREAGFTWDEDGRLRDPEGEPVEFTVATNASSGERVRMATLLQEDLDQLGIRVGTAALEFRALLGRIFTSYDYEACLLGLGGGDVDPNSAMNTWLSSGSHHFWRLGRSEPATEWEAEVDTLLQRQLVTLDPAERKRLYDRVQEVVAERVPMVFLVSPNVLVGASREVGNFRPAILDHPTLWNVEELYLRRGATTSAER